MKVHGRGSDAVQPRAKKQKRGNHSDTSTDVVPDCMTLHFENYLTLLQQIPIPMRCAFVSAQVGVSMWVWACV